MSLKVVLTWAQIAIGSLDSGIAHERQPNFRHRKKKENRKIERGEFITPPRPTGRRSKNNEISKDTATGSGGTFIFYNKIQKYVNAKMQTSSGGDENQGIYFIWPVDFIHFISQP